MKEGRGQTRALWHEDWRGNPSLFLSPRMAQTQGIVTRFVVAVKIWELWDNGHVGELAAFSLVIAIGTVMVGSIFLKIARHHGLQD